MSQICHHRDLHFLGRNKGVFCRFCGATWRRGKTAHGAHLTLTDERQSVGVLFQCEAAPQPGREEWR